MSVAEADPRERFAAMAAEARTKLEMVPELTDSPTTVFEAKRMLAKLAWHENGVAGSFMPDAAAEFGLRNFGHYAPHVDGLVRSARFHGKPWRSSAARWAAAANVRLPADVGAVL